MGIEAALIGLGSSLWALGGGTVAAAGASAAGASVIGAGTAAAIGAGTLGLAATGLATGVNAIANSGKSSGGGGADASAVKALTMSQLQAGNSNISNTMSGYTSNTLNTTRGRLLNL